MPELELAGARSWSAEFQGPGCVCSNFLASTVRLSDGSEFCADVVEAW